MATNFQGGQVSPQPQPRIFASLAKDLVAVVSLGILLIGVHDFASPFFRGFNCNDETIRYPYKDSTVSSGVCYITGSAINIGLILLLEYLNLVNVGTDETPSQAGSRKFQIRLYMRNVYCRLVVWFLGSIASELITDITKVTAGRLRPHFISVCKPTIFDGPGPMDVEAYCSQTKDPYAYITNYRCDGIPVLYIQSALDIAKLGLIKPAIQILIISMAFYTGLTRVSDYKHHWQDVLAGLILGTTVASVVSVYLWPPLYRSYSRLIRSPSQQLRPSLTGEELNRFSY